MSNIIKLKRGLDIQLLGAAEKTLSKLPMAAHYAVVPSDYIGVTPKLLVKVGDVVMAGTPLFFDKNNPEVLFVSPVSGVVDAVNRGDKRKILEIVITPDVNQEYKQFEIQDLAKASRQEVIDTILNSGLWPMMIQRPFGVIASMSDMPKAIFVSSFETAPLAADLNFILEGQNKNIQKGIDVLKKLTEGKVHLSLLQGNEAAFNELNGVEKHTFAGAHPAGNVGVQIHNIDPINKGEVVWTIDIQNLAILGKFFSTGKVDMSKKIEIGRAHV